MESLKHSPYTASRFRIWTTKGKKKLAEFLADMGLPLLQCNQTFDSMDIAIRREVCNWIEVGTPYILHFFKSFLVFFFFVGDRGH